MTADTVGADTSFVTVTDCPEPTLETELPSAAPVICFEVSLFFEYVTVKLASFGIISVKVRAIDPPSLATVAAVTVFVAPAAFVTVKSPPFGVPATASLVVIVIVVVPAFAAYALKVGRTPSMTIAWLSEIEFVAPGLGKVSVASALTRFRIVDPVPVGSSSDAVALYSKSLDAWELRTV